MNQPLPAPLAGDQLGTGGRYRVVRRLATGGMGEVLLCEFVGDDKVKPGLVVVKRTFPQHPNRAHQNEMMREEARVAVRLRHDNLVETFGIEEFSDGPLLTMEYLAGRSMAQVLGAAKRKNQPLPPAVCVEILRNCAFGLHFAHTLHDGARFLGLVHRDVSPANVFVTFDGRVKVIDFGVAKADDSELQTSTGILKGKLGYMAPEHASGEKLDARADIWSLGVVFWEMLAAERLFKGSNPAMTLRQIASMEIKPPSSFRPDIPPEIDAICLGMLRRERNDRISSGRELVERLNAMAGFVPGVAGIADLLTTRFPGEANQGMNEAQRAARSLASAPIPIGLVDGRGLGDDDPDLATAIVQTKDIQDLIAAAKADAPVAQVMDDLPKTVTFDVDVDGLELGMTDAPPASEARPEDGGTETANLLPSHLDSGKSREVGPRSAPPEIAASSGPLRQARPQSKPHSRARRRRGPSALAFGLSTFGVLSLILGLVFSVLTARQRKPPADLYLFYDATGGAVLVAHQEDVPAAHFENRFKVPLTERRDLPLSKDGPWVKPEPERFKALLTESGVWADAHVPHNRRDRLEVGLPALVAWLGLLSLAFSIPSFLLRGSAATIARILLTLGLLGGGAALGIRGGLGWPGLEKLQAHDESPAKILLKESLQPPGEKP